MRKMQPYEDINNQNNFFWYEQNII